MSIYRVRLPMGRILDVEVDEGPPEGTYKTRSGLEEAIADALLASQLLEPNEIAIQSYERIGAIS